GRLPAGHAARDVRLGHDPAQGPTDIHDEHPADLVLLEQREAGVDAGVFGYGDASLGHAVRRRHVERIELLGHRPADDVAIGDHAHRLHDAVALDHRDLAAVVLDHEARDLPEVRIRHA